MRILINGNAESFEQPPTVLEVLEQMGLTGRRVAVEVNREIIARGQHGVHCLQDGDEVEFVQAMGGG